MIKFISFLVYLTILNNNYMLFTGKNMKVTPAFINNTYPKYNISNNTIKINNKDNNDVPKYLTRKSKFCHIKCNCFFSHSVKNDNICVLNWLRPHVFN
jgi:hypothetical protein